MRLCERILKTQLYLSGERFQVSELSVRFKISARQMTKELRHLEAQGLLVRHIQGDKILYGRPSRNRWLTKPWTVSC
jgi:DNA-binding GntR family transcriptional regulator